MALTPTNLKLKERHATGPLLPLETRGPGVYRAKLAVRTNALLSSVYIRSADPGATVQVNYWDTTTGNENSPERYDLESHPLLTDAFAGSTSRVTVSRFHNKPQVEVIVTGGSVEFGVYISLIDYFTSELDNGLIIDGSVFDPPNSLGLPSMCLDEDSGLLNFLRCKDGGLTVSSPGDEHHRWDTKALVNDSFVDIFTETVPAGVKRVIHETGVSCPTTGVFELLVDGNIVASGRTAPAKPDAKRNFSKGKTVASGLEIKLRFKARSNGPSNPVDGYYEATDLEE